MSKQDQPSHADAKTIEVGSDGHLPGAVLDDTMKLAKHVICVSGLASDSVGEVTIDGRIALVQAHPESALYLCPLTPHSHPSYAKAWFYADCVSYEHDIPAVVYPQDSEFNKFGYRYVHSGPTKPQEHWIYEMSGRKKEKFIEQPVSPAEISMQYYMDHLILILEYTRQLRHGPRTFVFFRTYDCHREIDLPYTQVYGSVEKEISLYAAALRQADFLSEYLGYYRVIESATKTNGKQWIAASLPKLRNRDFGRIPIGHRRDYRAKPKNVISVYKQRAVSRYKNLMARLTTNEGISHYLYNVNRCGIAHGKDSVIKGHIMPTYFEVGRDTILLKLLARMAIEDKMAGALH